ncbi:hypothetical protein CPB83DRAFT_900439 [Crepidotus variabilis]|uniref:Uncharacterized protein n=1 Tax=Crepidotus variabilis TaxID=179855 RepID=A0A9P6E359_9AGAR|nr:hypothetical protein CPB83DRAFT_900439 [Crepidotus variabilis]
MTEVALDKIRCIDLPVPELWAVSRVSSKAIHGALVYSSTDKDEGLGTNLIDGATTEAILAQIYEGSTLPPIIICCESFPRSLSVLAPTTHPPSAGDTDHNLKTHTIPKVIRGNKIIHALVEFEKKYAERATLVQKDRLGSTRVTSVVDNYSRYPK